MKIYKTNRIQRKFVLYAVNGKWRSGIYAAFVWQQTPQGEDFWFAEAEKGPTLEGAKALLEIVEQAKSDGRLV